MVSGNAAVDNVIKFPNAYSGDDASNHRKQEVLRRYTIASKCMVVLSPNCFTRHENWNPHDIWSGGFDISVSVNMPLGSLHPLHLVLRYFDRGGEVFVPIDNLKSSLYTHALLSNSINLTVNGAIKNIGLYLMGDMKDLSLNVVEWSFIPNSQ